jgi:hypothetical protein
MLHVSVVLTGIKYMLFTACKLSLLPKHVAVLMEPIKFVVADGIRYIHFQITKLTFGLIYVAGI